MFHKKLTLLFIQVLNFTLCFCEMDNEAASVTPKINFVGGETIQDVDNPTYKELAEKSLQKYIQDSGDTQTYKEIKINNVSTQVVAGIKTTIDFIVYPDDCDGDIIKCKSIILQQAWKNLTDIDVTCEIVNKANRETISLSPEQ